ncbi:MAG TPA: methionine--tRNA ligase, partial [Candidatus Nanopusillus sp.]|nr:methionine--tRNA ligase [Candidatus Nanopusillus sp.]
MRVYITTPIYYPNDKPHIGSLYTVVLADFLTKLSKIMGYEAYMLTGLDEHGYKIYRSAKELGKSPLEFVDEMQKYFRESWERFQVDYFRFIRTSDKQHEDVVKYAIEMLYEKGYIYKGKYAGHYCVKCEAFYPTSKLIKEDNKYLCPIHNKEVEFLDEETYYLKISEFKDWIKSFIISNKSFITPKGYRNEAISYINELGDLSIARPRERVPWAVEIPFDKDFTVYVWIDALLNYLSAIGWPDDTYKDFWPATHIIGKDILKFHAVVWPILLKMLDMEPPRRVIVHGFWTVKGL